MSAKAQNGKRLRVGGVDADEEQARLMAEECLVVDENDKVIGTGSKKELHLKHNIEDGLLHRAFSVFLFDSKNRLLLQQRAGVKITFPLCWTNTCCSHPLNVEAEREEKGHLGVKRAAQRKLEHELGIAKDVIKLSEFKFVTKMHYKAFSDGEWGEHEIDHIMLVKKDVETKGNENEVEELKYVTAEELKEMFAQKEGGEIILSPWFQMIAENFLFDWWKRLDEICAPDSNIETGPQSTKIYRLKLKESDPNHAKTNGKRK